jgi:ubiquinone/menaquinone biosynthesis C-methylase UbiE
LEAEKDNLARLLALYAKSPSLHLDIGAGTGDSLPLFHLSRQLTCLDASLAMLRRLQAPVPKLVANAEALPFAEATFDFVSAIGVLEYVQDAARLFEEAHRVLQPQGYFLFTSAPRVPANYLRTLWGERLYLRNAIEVLAELPAPHWRLVAHERTLLQEQWLVQHLVVQYSC